MMPNLKSLPKRQRLLILIAGGCVVLLILNSIVFSPLSDLWSSHAMEIKKLEGEVADGRSVVARGPQTRRVWSDIQTGALPKDQAQAEHDVLANVESWGRASGVELGSRKPLWKHGQTPAYSLLELRLDATGPLSALSLFLYYMEKSPLALKVDSVELISRDDTGEKLTLSMIVTGLKLAPLDGKP